MITGRAATRAVTFLVRTLSGENKNMSVPEHLSSVVPFELDENAAVNQAVRRIRRALDMDASADDARLPDVRFMVPFSDNPLAIPRSPSIMVVSDGVSATGVVECHIILFVNRGDVIHDALVNVPMRWEEGIMSWALDQYLEAVKLCFRRELQDSLGSNARDCEVLSVDLGDTQFLRLAADGTTLDASMAAAVFDLQVDVTVA